MGMWDAKTISPEINGEGPAVHDLAPSRGLHGHKRLTSGGVPCRHLRRMFHMQRLPLLLRAASMRDVAK